MKSLIIGKGEIGKSLWKVIGGEIRDKNPLKVEGVQIMHICIPYSNRFVSTVKEYQKLYKPKYTVIHSTVPVGTSSVLNATHSPVRGQHPHLEGGIRTFTKFVGGKDADEVVDYFRRFGMKTYLCRKSETTELLKLLDTTYYKKCIEFAQLAEKLCNKFNVPFSEVYTLANQTYNEGYEKLGRKDYIRPVLQPLQKKIGGHCVRENYELLKKHL
jgi:UDP-N-acetyl-D-mannosaminuronate dehydrogenase